MVLGFWGPKTSNESILESVLQGLVPTPSEESQPCQLTKSQGTAEGPFVLWSPFECETSDKRLVDEKRRILCGGKGRLLDGRNLQTEARLQSSSSGKNSEATCMSGVYLSPLMRQISFSSKNVGIVSSQS